MKTKIIALAAALCLLVGCSNSKGEYYTESVHKERDNAELQSVNTSDIAGYYTLKGAMLNMVNMGVTEDVLRIGSYNGDLEADLKSIIQEITTEEPMGIYCVLSISVDQTRVLMYQELTVTIQYKKTPEEIRSVVPVSGEYELHNRLISMLSEFSQKGVFAVQDGAGSSNSIEQDIYSLWMQCGEKAMGLDKIEVNYYPEQSENCILEMALWYGSSAETLEKRSSLVKETAEKICSESTDASESVIPKFIYNYLSNHVLYDNSAQRVVNETKAQQPKTVGYTAYGALINHEAAQSGFVLAASVMCDCLGVEHTVETGKVGEDIYSWISLELDGQSYIFDVTAGQNGRKNYLVPIKDAEGIYSIWE
ncbi:MAG: hypothetical protein VB078_11140 [Clostridiaceae bacterium]|nr:hypothetical protein [Clostridiaceae bacterium]